MISKIFFDIVYRIFIFLKTAMGIFEDLFDKAKSFFAESSSEAARVQVIYSLVRFITSITETLLLRVIGSFTRCN
jgi:hypothetical protein